MKIAILSDVHDNIWNLEKASKQTKEMGCEAIIFCGDFGGPPTAEKLVESNLPLYAVFGNIDGAVQEITSMTNERFILFKVFGEFELGNRKIGLCHYPELAEGLASTGKYDAVFHGHTHTSRVEKIGKTFLVNPGEIAGFKNEPSFGVYDTETNEVKIIPLVK